jgi:hypothetical protein
MTLGTSNAACDAMSAEAQVVTSSGHRHPISAARPIISASVDYLIWKIRTAAHEHDVREARLMLADAIESYAAEAINRLRHSGRRGVRLPPFSDV